GVLHRAGAAAEIATRIDDLGASGSERELGPRFLDDERSKTAEAIAADIEALKLDWGVLDVGGPGRRGKAGCGEESCDERSGGKIEIHNELMIQVNAARGYIAATAWCPAQGARSGTACRSPN